MTDPAPDLRALDGKRIGFIGCGAMASALAGGLANAGIPVDRLCGSDPDPGQRKHFGEATGGAATFAANADVTEQSDVVVLAVKPGIVAAALADAASGEAGPLWVSIAAGVQIASLEAALPAAARVVRAMPNTPALVAAGATAFAANAAASDTDRAMADALFRAVGESWEAPNEGLLDAVTGLSGSGPAYVFVVLEAMADAGVRQGLPRDVAQRLAIQTVYGAAKLARESGRHPAALKDQVTSPGGTTIAGVEQLEAGGVRAAFYRAVEAATKRSRELAGS